MAIAVYEGLVVAAMLAFTESFIVPLLQTRLHATPSQIGLLTIVPLLGTVFTGIVLGRIIRFLGGNKRAVVWHTIVQSVMIGGLSLPLHNPQAEWAVPLGLGMAICIALAGSVGGAAWMSWMGALVPRRLQSRYLAYRNRLVILAKLGCALLFGYILQSLPVEAGPWGLQVLIALAVISRLASGWMLWLQHEPAHPAQRPGSSTDSQHAGETSFVGFLRTITATDLGRWTLVWAVLHLGVMLAGPYFATYMLYVEPRGLGLSPGWTYVMLIQIAVLVRIATYPLAGRLVDLFGPAAILRVAVVGIVVIPISWALTRSIPLLLMTEFISGFCWCLAEVSVGVLLFTCHRDPHKRSRLIGYHQSVVNFAAAIGAIGGSVLLAQGLSSNGTSLLPELDGSDYHTLFLLSALFRLPAVILAIRFLPSLRALRAEESAGLWRLIPGTDLVLTLSKGLMGYFRRPEG
jgi:MFS family permease